MVLGNAMPMLYEHRHGVGQVVPIKGALGPVSSASSSPASLLRHLGLSLYC